MFLRLSECVKRNRNYVLLQVSFVGNYACQNEIEQYCGYDTRKECEYDEYNPYDGGIRIEVFGCTAANSANPFVI